MHNIYRNFKLWHKKHDFLKRKSEFLRGGIRGVPSHQSSHGKREFQVKSKLRWQCDSHPINHSTPSHHQSFTGTPTDSLRLELLAMTPLHARYRSTQMLHGLVSSINSNGRGDVIDHYQNDHRSSCSPNEINNPDRSDKLLNALTTLSMLSTRVVSCARAKSADGEYVFLFTANPDDLDGYDFTQMAALAPAGADLAIVVPPGKSYFSSVRTASWETVFAVRYHYGSDLQR